MTKGNAKVIFRVPTAMLSEMREAIERHNRRTREEPWDLSTFVRNCIRDKLRHMKRSRRPRTARRASERAPANLEGPNDGGRDL